MIQYESLYSAFPALVAKILLRKKIIGDEVILMSRETKSPLRYVLYAFDRFLIRMTDYVITSSTSAEVLIRKWFPKKPVYLVMNGVEPVKRRDRPASRDRHELVFVGSLSSPENRVAIENVLRLAELLERKGIEFHITVVGGPWSYAAPYLGENMVRRGRVTFKGAIKGSELFEVYSTASVGLLPFFMPSGGGQKIKALEYLAHQLLVLSGPFGFGNLPGIVPGVHYLEAANVAEMSEWAVDFVSHPAAYSQIAEAGRRLVEQQFSWEVTSKPYLEILSAIESQKGG
jgi:glycosyltransferase involved in cell wall biosynthesis